MSSEQEYREVLERRVKLLKKMFEYDIKGCLAMPNPMLELDELFNILYNYSRNKIKEIELTEQFR